MTLYKATVTKTLIYEIEVEATSLDDAASQANSTDLADKTFIENKSISVYPA